MLSGFNGRSSLGNGSYKRSTLADCPEIFEYPEDPEQLLAEDVIMPCELCKRFGNELISRAMRENTRVKSQLSKKLMEYHPIANDDLCSWVTECHSREDCQGCDYSPENLLEWLEKIVLEAKVPRPVFRPPVIVGEVGSSFFSPRS